MSPESLLTFLLILATVYYNRKTISEMRGQKILDAKPLIIIEKMLINDSKAHEGHYSCIHCVLQNIGKGPALNLHVGIYDEVNDRQIATSTNFIDFLSIESKTDDSHIHLNNKALNQLAYKSDGDGEMVARVKVMVHYNDLFDNTYFAERLFSFTKGHSTFEAIVGSYTTKSNLISKMEKIFKKRKWNLPPKIINKLT